MPPVCACEGWSYRPTSQVTEVSVLRMVWLPVRVSTSFWVMLVPVEVSENVNTLVPAPLIEPMLALPGLVMATLPASSSIVSEHSRRA